MLQMKFEPNWASGFNLSSKELMFEVLIDNRQCCTTIHRYPIFSTRYSVMCKIYGGYCGPNEIQHGLCACTVDNPLAKTRGLSLRTGAQTMLYLSSVVWPMEFLLMYP